MSVEILTYGALGARLNISPAAARSLARRLRLPRSLSEDGKALVSVDLTEIRHTPQPPGRRQSGDVAGWTAQVAALQVEIAQLEAMSAGHRADFEHERERADRLMAELLQANCRGHDRQGDGGAARRGGRLPARPVPAPTVRSKRRNAGWGNSPRRWWNQTARRRVGSFPSLLNPPCGGAIVGQR